MRMRQSVLLPGWCCCSRGGLARVIYVGRVNYETTHSQPKLPPAVVDIITLLSWVLRIAWEAGSSIRQAGISRCLDNNTCSDMEMPAGAP